MKNLLKLALVFVAIFSTIAATTKEMDFLLYVKEGKGKLISLKINGIQQVNFSIYDNEGQRIFSEQATGKGGIEKTFNLEELPTGQYTLEVENNFKKMTYGITVSDVNATISSEIVSLYKFTKNKNNVLAKN